jgi:hypothetical protein
MLQKITKQIETTKTNNKLLTHKVGLRQAHQPLTNQQYCTSALTKEEHARTHAFFIH